MKPEIKEKFIKALTSGEYKQTFEALRRGNCFCVLGVLCDLYSKEKNIKWKEWHGNEYEIHNNSALLPKEVIEWSGISNKEDSILLNLNDSVRHSFDKIAKIIEKKF